MAIRSVNENCTREIADRLQLQQQIDEVVQEDETFTDTDEIDPTREYVEFEMNCEVILRRWPGYRLREWRSGLDYIDITDDN